jgi:hypothetical protein
MFIVRCALVLPFVLALSTASCTHQETVPSALTQARFECARAVAGPAQQLEPAAAGDAEAACHDAEVAYRQDRDRAPPLALLAQRKAQLAESLAATEIARREQRDPVSQLQALLEARAAEARAIAEHDAGIRSQRGAAEMQPKTDQRSR